MKLRKFVVIASVYLLGMVWLVILARFYSNLLQVPAQISNVLTILLLFTGTIGGVIGLIRFYAKRKR